MNSRDTALAFDCAGERLFGILSRPDTSRDTGTGIVIVVGGPQTRVGSHRQFVMLARALAANGFPVLRFDVRGMGDSEGAQRSFDTLTPDIRAAVDALQSEYPDLRRVVLWGLCDAAAASLLYIDETADPRIAGLCLLNPWVRSEASLAKTQVKHYYGQRLLQKEFWAKLLGGRLNVFAALAELLRKLGQSRRKDATGSQLSFQQRMARGLRRFDGRTLLILSGDDYTAKEFLEYTASDDAWSGLLDRPELTRIDVPAADHTFSSREWRATVENSCLVWLTQYD